MEIANLGHKNKNVSLILPPRSCMRGSDRGEFNIAASGVKKKDVIEVIGVVFRISAILAAVEIGVPKLVNCQCILPPQFQTHKFVDEFRESLSTAFILCGFADRHALDVVIPKNKYGISCMALLQCTKTLMIACCLEPQMTIDNDNFDSNVNQAAHDKPVIRRQCGCINAMRKRDFSRRTFSIELSINVGYTFSDLLND